MADVIWCAEIGSSHGGNPSLAYELIRQAKIAGATIAKFQLGHDLSDQIRGMPTRLANTMKFWCDAEGIEFMSSIFTPEAFSLAEALGQQRYKFPSRRAFIRHSTAGYDETLMPILETGKEVFLSDIGHGEHDNVRNVYVQPKYPTYPTEFVMPDRFEEWFGYSSHVHGFGDALIAVARGAGYVEKHITLNKTDQSIRDNQFALDPDEFGMMVRMGNEIARLL